MIAQILTRTPAWVWPLLAVLFVLGWTQARDRRVAPARLALLPVAMTLLSLAGTLSSFGRGASLLAAWAAAWGLAAAAVARSRPPRGAAFDRTAGLFAVPGSWVPMLLILAIFLTKYGVGVALGMQPALASDAAFAHAVGAAYGLFSGVFAGRAVRLLRLRRDPALARRQRMMPWLLGALAAAVLLPVALLAALIVFGTRDAPPPLAVLNDAVARADHTGLPPLEAFAARNGSALAWRFYKAGPGAPVAVLVHGSSGDSHAMHGVGRALAAAGIAAYALDLRGHGASIPRGDIDHPGQLDDDLADVAALLRKRHPRARLALVGHSSGGGFVLRIAGGQPELFDAYLMLAPLLHQDAPTTRPDAGGWVAPYVPRIVALGLLERAGLPWFQHLPVLAFALPPQTTAVRTPTYSYRLQANFRPHDDYLGDLRRIARPAALLIGADDELFVADAYAPLVASVRPDLPVRVLPGVTHIGIVQDRAALAAVVEALRALWGAEAAP